MAVTKKNSADSIKDGYSFFMNNASTFVGSTETVQTSGQYIGDVNEKILWLKDAINNNGNNNPSNSGYLAEYWHDGTCKISAAILRTNTWTHVEDSQESRSVLGGADITTSWEQDYGLKYCKDGKASAMAQATTIKQRYMEYIHNHPDCSKEEYLRVHGLDENTDINLPLYESQARLIPSDQLEAAKEALQRRIDHDIAVGGEQAKDVLALIQTKNALTDHIEGPNGEKSFPLTYEQAKQLQKCAKNGNFDPSKYDISAARLADKSYLLSNSVQAGINAAWTSVLLKIVPEIISVLKKAVEDDELSIDDLKKLGTDTIENSSLGFIRGVFTSSITTSIELGYWGESLQLASLRPDFAASIAVVVATAMSIAGDSIKLARGKITKEEFVYKVEKTVFIASASYICGIAVQGLMLEMPTIGYMLGSFVGSILGGLVFEAKERAFISICINKGWTFFGLVKQDYELPKEVMRKLGFNEMHYDEIHYEQMHYNELSYNSITYNELHYDKLDVIMVRRGVIGVRKIGYISR